MPTADDEVKFIAEDVLSASQREVHRGTCGSDTPHHSNSAESDIWLVRSGYFSEAARLHDKFDERPVH
jgi:hypothetical protein